MLSIAATRRGKGSTCEVVFANAQQLSLARVKINEARKSFTDGRTAWLDARKNRETRLRHRVHDYLVKIAAARITGPNDVVKDLATKTVKVNNDVVGYPRGKSWHWTEKANGFYTAEERDMAGTFASQQ